MSDRNYLAYWITWWYVIFCVDCKLMKPKIRLDVCLTCIGRSSSSALKVTSAILYLWAIRTRDVLLEHISVPREDFETNKKIDYGYRIWDASWYKDFETPRMVKVSERVERWSLSGSLALYREEKIRKNQSSASNALRSTSWFTLTYI